jgi:hypothetical protein
MINYLNQLDLSEVEIFESLGQILDCLSQSLELLEKRITGKLSISRSFSDFQHLLEKEHKTEYLSIKLSLIREFRKTINIKKPQLESVIELRKKVIEFLLDSKTDDLIPLKRIRYKPELVNVTGVETLSGFKQFKVYHGSISHIPCSTLVISANITQDEIDGQIINALKWRFNFDFSTYKLLYQDHQCKILYINTIHTEAPFDNLIIIGIDNKVGILSNEDYKAKIKILFASLCTVEYLAENPMNFGFSFICGNRIESKNEAVNTIVLESLSWLKQAQKCDSIHCCLFHKEELDLWNRSMDETLGRNTINTSDNQFISTLRNEIISL